MTKGIIMMDIKKIVEQRDNAFECAVLEDNWWPALEYCEEHEIEIPGNFEVFKAGIYKAVSRCTGLSQEVKDLAAKKCVELGFKPKINLE